jgi:hypothetical protein
VRLQVFPVANGSHLLARMMPGGVQKSNRAKNSCRWVFSSTFSPLFLAQKVGVPFFAAGSEERRG